MRAVVPNEPLLKAVDYLRERNHSGQRGLDEDVPLDFIPVTWQPHVCPQPGVVDRALWEICLLDQLRQTLKSGNVHVPHSRAFQPIESYLLSREQWEQEKITLTQEHQLPLAYEQHWPKVAELLRDQVSLFELAVRYELPFEIDQEGKGFQDAVMLASVIEHLHANQDLVALLVTVTRCCQRLVSASL